MSNLYLRFTVDADADLSRGYSFDTLEESEIEMLMERYDLDSRSALIGKEYNGKVIESIGDWDFATPCGDSGLCGHLLESTTVEDAIAEVAAKNNGGIGWYMDADAQDWAIFSGDESGALVYADGDCFTPNDILYRSGK